MADSLLQIAHRIKEIRERVDQVRVSVGRGADFAKTHASRLSEILRRLTPRPEIGNRPAELLARMSHSARRLAQISQHLHALGYELDILLHHLVVTSTPAGRAEPGHDGDALPKPLFVEDAARKLPVRTKEGEKTHGRAFNRFGLPIGDGVIESGYTGPARDAEGIDPRQRLLFGAHFARTHVEAHLAAMMRKRRDFNDVTLVINNVPDRDQVGCQKYLQDIMPRGSSMAVYVKDDKGLRYWGRFSGNGKAVLDDDL